MAAFNSVDRPTFLNFLCKSGLVGNEEIVRISQEFADQPRGRPIARALVERGLLTRFQAERLLIGRTSGFLLGQYRILEQIGRGGMGRVYKAEHQTMKRIVALKVLSADLLATDRAVQLFLHEVRAVAQIVHPNIVTAFDADQVNGRYYLVLEYVNGPNLDQLVRKQGPLTVGLACDYIRQAANGLQCAHAQGMVHRDIKPANIIVQQHGLNGDASPGLVKIGDFGLARLTQPIGTSTSGSESGTIVTFDNAIMGTPDYLSPEQTRCVHTADIRSDLYSLGGTFYFLLTGAVPYPGGNAMDKLIRNATQRPAPISGFRSDVPAEVSAMIDKLMAKNPDERFDTPADLAEALAPYAVSGPTPWAPIRSYPSLPFVDAFATPADSLTSETRNSDLDDIDVELASLSSPLSGGEIPIPPLIAPHQVKHREHQGASRIRLAVGIAIGIVAGLLALIAVVSLTGK